LKLAERLSKKRALYLLNVRPAEAEIYAKARGGKKCKVTTLDKINCIDRGSAVFAEDLISLTKKEIDGLRQGLNYTAHHRLAKIFCVAHTIYRTGLFSALPLFNYVIFTCSPSNVPIVRQTLSAFKVDPPQLAHWINLVKNGRYEAEGNYFFFDCTKMLFGVAGDYLRADTALILGNLSESPQTCHWSAPLPGGSKSLLSKRESQQSSAGSVIGSGEKNIIGSPDADAALAAFRLEQARCLFADYFAGHSKKTRACAIFASIQRGLPEKLIDSADLTVTFRRPHGERVKISLVDYVAALLDPTGRGYTLPNRNLHKFVAKKCTLPKSAIDNPQFFA
jgi:hypothetical protein